MYRLVKKIVYLFTFYCCLDFLFFDFPVPAVSFPDAVVFFDVFLQFFYFFWKLFTWSSTNKLVSRLVSWGWGNNSPIRSVSKRLLGHLTRRRIIRSGIRIGSDCH